MRLAFLLLLFVGPTIAKARWLTMQESGSVIEKFHIDYDVFKNGSSSQTIDYVTRVQAEDAKVNASIFNIEYNGVTDQVEILDAYTLNGKRKFKVEPSAIEDRDKGESRDYDVQKVRSVVFPQVEIGSRLVIKYRMKTTKPVVEDRWSKSISLSPGYYLLDFRLRVKSEAPLFFELRDPQKFLSLKQKNPRSIEVRNRKTLPGWVHAEKDPYFHPAQRTEVWLSTHKQWPAFFATLNRDFEQILASGVPPALKGWVKNAASRKTAAEKIGFLLERLSKEFRYFGDWRRHNGGLVPRPLKEIEASRYGDCKDLSSLLVAMLRALKMDANVVLVRRGENPWGQEPDFGLPALERFNHAIVLVNDGESKYWLDPTNPVASLKPYPDISGRPSWVLTPKGGRSERLPADRAEDFVHDYNYVYQFRSDDSVTVKVNATMKGLAPYDMANDLMMAPRSSVLTETLEYFSEGQEVRSFRYLKEPNTGRLLKDMDMKLEYETGRVTFNAGKAAFWAVPDGFLRGAFYETEDRVSDLRLTTSPFVFRTHRRLKNAKLAQEAPALCRLESRWMNVERKIHEEGGDVVIRQNVELKRPYITRQEFRSSEFKKLQAEARRCFYRSGVLLSLNRQ